MDKMKVYLAMAHFEYEGNEIIKAFRIRNEAELFVEKCEEYEKTRISFPEENENVFDKWQEIKNEISDKKFDEWHENTQIWLKNHPAENFTDADSYYVREMEVI